VDVGAEGGVDATVTSNNKQAGQLDGKYVADRLKGKGTDRDCEWTARKRGDSTGWQAFLKK
jgi:ABC-type sugar transport system substrate-binding protein